MSKPSEKAMQHDLYKGVDPQAPDAIKDRDGQVVLAMCKNCGLGECELTEQPICSGSRAVYYHLGTTVIKVPNQTVHDMLENAVKRHTATELEAQHRKTWALAIKKHVSFLDTRLTWFASIFLDTHPNNRSEIIFRESESEIIKDHILTLPCPPIEATKDK